MSNRGRGNPSDNRGRGGGFRGGAPQQGGGAGRGGGGFAAGGSAGRGGGGVAAGGRGGGGFRGGPPQQGRGGGGFRGGAPQGPTIYAETSQARISEELSEQNLQQLVGSFKSMRVRAERPNRPGFGTLGTPILLRANFFAIKEVKQPIFNYVVKASTLAKGASELKLREERNRLFKLLEDAPLFSPYLDHIAHDSSERLVSARKLPQPFDVPIAFYEEGQLPSTSKPYTVSLVFESEIQTRAINDFLRGDPDAREYNTAPIISALNLVMQQHATRTGVRVGRASNQDRKSNPRYFFNSTQKMQLGMGTEAWAGFFLSVRPCFNRLMVNVNACWAAFVEPGNLADALMAFRTSAHTMPRLPEGMTKTIKVRTLHLGYKKSIYAVGTTSARNTFFDCAEFNGQISVEQYFKKKYKKTLQYPEELPVVNIGTAKKTNWVPAELCEIFANQPYRGKLSDRETAQMIRYACNPPRVNAEAIVDKGFPTLGLSPAVPLLSSFGIDVSNQMAVIPGRELPAPNLTYHRGRTNVSNGSWNLNEVEFHRGAEVRSWWVLVVRDGPKPTIQGPDDPQLVNLIDGFTKKLRKCGLRMPQGKPHLRAVALGPPANDLNRAASIQKIKDCIQEGLLAAPRPDFILVLLENRDNYIYPGIKRIGDVTLGIHTIHMQLSKAFVEPRKQDQYFSNVALKVNTKLGGINHLLDDQAMAWLKKKKTMMIGIDVTHPGPGSRKGTPSIACVVASVDDSFVQFPASIRIQKSKQEEVEEISDMVVERLKLYEKKNKMLPERIFVFRDGVSEDQYDMVVAKEFPHILEAFRKLSTKDRKTLYRPTVSIVVCGKRHHARFFATNSQFADRNGNTRPGTVVDKGVTAIFDFDFFLQPHAGLQGTVKATHYVVVYDENKFGADEIQQGTHTASYLYARATKAVSLIPPAYYADLACERGRCYLNDFLVDDKSSVGTSSKLRGKLAAEEEEERVYQKAKAAWGNGLHLSMSESMFYI